MIRDAKATIFWLELCVVESNHRGQGAADYAERTFEHIIIRAHSQLPLGYYADNGKSYHAIDDLGKLILKAVLQGFTLDVFCLILLLILSRVVNEVELFPNTYPNETDKYSTWH